jgi:hypothetical protein
MRRACGSRASFLKASLVPRNHVNGMDSTGERKETRFRKFGEMHLWVSMGNQLHILPNLRKSVRRMWTGNNVRLVCGGFRYLH